MIPVFKTNYILHIYNKYKDVKYDIHKYAVVRQDRKGKGKESREFQLCAI